MFYIRSKTGKRIPSCLSAHPGEAEVMSRPGTFRVDDVSFLGDGLAIVVLEELRE